MKKIIKYFGSQAELARFLSVHPNVVNNWTRRGIPADQAIKLEILTKGKLKAVDIYE